MTDSTASLPERIPINPYWVGGSFLDYCARQGWVLKEGKGKSLRFYATPAGVKALKQFGIAIRVR
jgi:hypothetical protein